MEVRKLGNQGLMTSPIGLGCMGMTQFGGNDVYGRAADEKEAIQTIHKSKELGVNLLDTADVYGPLENERLIAKAISGDRDNYIVATKFGEEVDDSGKFTFKINCSPSYVKKAIERSLRNLKTDYIDLYYMHRLDRNIPIEETIGAMSDLIKEGKVKYIGLSEVSSEIIKKANDTHPLTAIQSEYSIFERTIERHGILNTCRELGIGFVGYSPLCRGLLTGNIKSKSDIKNNDWRKTIPRFQGEQFEQNLAYLEELEIYAKSKNVSLSQLAIAWSIKKGVIPIPGTRTRKYLDHNLQAAQIDLSENEMSEIEAILPLHINTGDRYDENTMKLIDQ